MTVDVLVTGDQQLFCETTERFLARECPLPKVRELARDEAGFDRAVWRRGAELGWTSLLVPEALGGGAITGAGMTDLAALAGVFGAHVAPGPLLPTNLVAGAIARAGTPAQQSELLPGLTAGETVATWAHMEAGVPALDAPRAVRAAPDGDGFVLDGVKTPVEAGAQAGVLLVTALADDGPVQLLVDPAAAGVTVTPLESIDLVRRYARVEFHGVRVPTAARVGTPATTAAVVEWQLEVAAVVQSAEMAGAAHVAFDLTLVWTFDRYTFGRPLASYQAIKHRVADAKLWLEAAHGLVAAAAAELDAGAPSSAETVSAAKAYCGDRLAGVVHECVQLHGGIGLTYEHDLHLYLRRVLADRVTYGTPADHRLRIAELRERST